jgi:hypothetical protein
LTGAVGQATVSPVGFLRPKGHRTATGRALVITAGGLALQNAYSTGTTAVHSKIQVRVTPDDGGPEFNSEASVWGGDEQYLRAGHWTYVLYDRERTAGCDIDAARLDTEFGLVNGKQHRTSVPQWVSDEWTKKPVASGDEASSGPTVIDTADLAGSLQGSQGVVAGLKDLAQLHASGALSDAEYADAKSRLLAQS